MVKFRDEPSRRLPVTDHLIRAIGKDSPDAQEQYIIYDAEGKEREVQIKTATTDRIDVYVPAFEGSRQATAIHTHPASDVTLNKKEVIIGSPFPSTSDMLIVMKHGVGSMIVVSRVSERDAFCSYITGFPEGVDAAQKLGNKYESIRQTIMGQLKDVAQRSPAGDLILTIAAANTTLGKMAEKHNLSYGLYHIYLGDVNISVNAATIEDIVHGVHEP